MRAAGAAMPDCDGADAMTESYRDFRHFTMTMDDGTVLDVYECGEPDRPPALIVNPIGVPVVLASRLMRALGARYRVRCWEQRGCRATSREFLARPHDYQDFVADLVQMFRHEDGRPCAVIGICSGASLALSAVAAGSVTATPLVLVSPAVRFTEGYSPSIFDHAAVPYLRLIAAGDRAIAAAFLQLKTLHADGNRGAIDVDERLIVAADQWSLRSLDSLSAYATMVNTFAAQRLDAPIRQVRQHVSIVSAADDQTVSIASVRQLAFLLPDADLSEHAQGGHFLVFTDPRARDAVCRCVAAAHST